MNVKKYVVIKQDVIKTTEGEILTEVNPKDILIVEFDDMFFKDMNRTVFARDLQKCDRIVSLIKRRPDGLYERFEVEREV